MVRGTEPQFRTHRFLESFPEVRCESRISIGDNLARTPVIPEEKFYKYTCESPTRGVRPERNKVRHLSQCVHNHPYRITTTRGSRKTTHKIHRDYLELTSLLIQRLE